MYHPLGATISVRGSGDGRVTSFRGELLGKGMALQPVAVALDVDHLAMVQKAVKDGRRYDRITKELLPVRGSALDRRYFLTVLRESPVIREISRMPLCCLSLRILTSMLSSFPIMPTSRSARIQECGSKFSFRGGSFLHFR